MSGRKSFKMAAIGFVVALVLVIACGAAYTQLEKPTFCGGCHAMSDNYATWHESSHASIACSECHLPHDNMVQTLAAKTATGLADVYHETMRDYGLDIRTTDKGKEYLQKNCVRCHEATIRDTGMGCGKDSDGRQCISCHRNLVHGDMTISQ